MFLFGGLKKTVHRNTEGFGQNRTLCLSFREFLYTIQDPLFNITERQDAYNSRFFAGNLEFSTCRLTDHCGKANFTP
jgi:hypothetical protein